MSNTPHSLTLHNPKNHRKSLEFCVASCSLEFSVDSNSESNSTESKQFTQSTTLKTLIKALPLAWCGFYGLTTANKKLVIVVVLWEFCGDLGVGVT